MNGSDTAMKFVKRLSIAAIVMLSAIGSARALSAKETEEKPNLAAVDFQGNKAFSSEELQKVIALRESDVADAGRLDAARMMLRSHYQARGYLDAQVEASVSWRDNRPLAVFSIREGPQYRFGHTTIEGLTRYPKYTVFRELTYKEGQPFDQRELFNTQEKLYLSGLFKDIRVNTSTTPAHDVDVGIRLKAAPTILLNGGIGYGSEERERFSLSITDKNLFHRDYRLETGGSVSAIRRETHMEFLDRYLFGTRTQFRQRVQWTHENREGYDFESFTARPAVSRSLGRGITGEAAYKLENTVTFNIHPDFAATTPPTALASAVELAVNRDSTDDPFFPRRGGRQSLHYEHSGGFFGGTVNFNKLYAKVSQYQKLFGKVIAAAQARGGWSRAFAPSAEIPVYDRFFTGGANSVRGYAERSLGPKDSEGAPLGGTMEAGASAEIRIPLFWKFNAGVFIDGGQVSYDRRAVQPSLWKYGAGAGIRFMTPVGPLRLDYGYKLNPDPGERVLWRLHFSLGEAF